jgi:hypothetical protein
VLTTITEKRPQILVDKKADEGELKKEIAKEKKKIKAAGGHKKKWS